MDIEVADTRVGVLASGRGSNFEALLRAQSAGNLWPARIVAFATDKPGCGAMAIAAAAGIAIYARTHKDAGGRAAWERSVADLFSANGITVVALAGYMRLVGPELLNAFPQGILNIHPSLLPAFPGLDAQKQALEHGVKVAGCTVHLVDSGLDSGPILAQRAVPVMESDDAEALSQRILAEEHATYAATLKRFCSVPYQVVGRRVVWADGA